MNSCFGSQQFVSSKKANVAHVRLQLRRLPANGRRVVSLPIFRIAFGSLPAASEKASRRLSLLLGTTTAPLSDWQRPCLCCCRVGVDKHDNVSNRHTVPD